MKKLFVTLLTLISFNNSGFAQTIPVDGKLTCTIYHLDKDQLLINSYNEGTSLKFEQEDVYWYADIHIEKFQLDIHYSHTMAASGDRLYSGVIEIKSTEKESGKVSFSMTNLPMNGYLIHQFPVKEFKIDNRIVSYVRASCSYN
ncbi:MAG: hypothetical protein V4654_13365 [Bdellovibrionota bacterium]